jgi:hypothetical protein
MTNFALIAFAAVLALLAVGSYRVLHRWRVRRRAAWELERAAWRLWISRPDHERSVMAVAP